MNLVQLTNKLITVHGNSILIHKGANAKIVREKQIFSKSKIIFLISIGEKDDEKAFFLAISSKRIALFQLKKESPIAIFKLDEQIVYHGTVQVLDMERRKEGEFRVRMIIPIAFASGTVRKMRLIVHFDGSQITTQKMKCLEEMRMEDEKMRLFDLWNDNFFGFFEETIVKSDGLVTRAEEPSAKKRKRIAVVGRELWHGNILLATENGSIRVVSVKDDRNNSRDALTILSEGQCVPPYCTLRCREPSVIISTENTVIVGTQRGEIHFLNERLELRCVIDTEGGPIKCLKVDEYDADFLWVEFENGELRRMLFMLDSEQNDSLMAWQDVPVRLVLEHITGTKYRVAWEATWVEAKGVKPSVDHLKNLKILGITNDSDERQIMQAKFVIENLGVKSKENQQETWTYQKLREKAPELLLDFYEQQLEK